MDLLTIPKEYDTEINEYIAQLEQLILLLGDELEEKPNAGFSPELVEILDMRMSVIAKGQKKRKDFGARLRKVFD